MTEDYWAHTHLSVVRYTGSISLNGHTFTICDKTGRDIFELSEIANREGRDKAIAPGEPCDLVRNDIIPAYRALGRDRILDMVEMDATADEILAEAERVNNESYRCPKK